MPLLGRNERQQPIPFFFRKNRVVQRSVGQIRFGGTENRNDAHTPHGAAERETNQSVRGFIPLPNAQEFLPAAFVETIVVLLHAQGALPLFRNRNGRKYYIGMIAIAAITNGATIQSTPQFAGNRAAGSALRFLGDSADLDLTLPLDKMA